MGVCVAGNEALRPEHTAGAAGTAQSAVEPPRNFMGFLKLQDTDTGALTKSSTEKTLLPKDIGLRYALFPRWFGAL